MEHPNSPDPKQALGFRPLYMQVQDLLVQRLASGEWSPGVMLPSEPELADMYNVSQGTIRKALDKMALLNLVVRRQGKGTFVSSHTAHRALFHFFHVTGNDGSRQLPESRVLSCRTRRATRQEAEQLALDEKARVVVIERLRSLNHRPTLTEAIVVSESLFPGLGRGGGRDLPNTIYEYYEQRYRVTIVNAVERLRAELANARDMELLGLPRGAPVLVIDRIAFGHKKVPVEWRVSRCDTSHHHYLSEIE